MKRVKSLKGVELYEASDGRLRVGIVYTVRGKMRREMLGDLGEKDEAIRSDVNAIRDRRMLPAAYKDYPSLVAAVRTLRERRAAGQEAKLSGKAYLTPREQAEVDERAAAEAESAIQDARAPLVYEAAVKRFLAERGASYARPRDVELRFEIIGKAFAGRHLDEIVRRDIRQYVRDRTDRTGPFADWPHAVGLRPAQMDVVQLSALFGFLIESEEREIENPCAQYRSRHAHTKAETYRPQRKPVVPTEEECLAIFAAAPDEEASGFNRHLPGPTFRAFLKLCYYLGARPESEACALRHGDVTFPDPNVPTIGRRRLGRVRIHDAKTAAGDRELPIHPELEADLKAVMLPRPSEPEAVEAWKRTPIFRKVARTRTAVLAWNASSYKKAWAETLERVTEKYPDLAAMIVRDFRKLARTRMTDGRIPEPRIRWFMGHARNVSQGYDEITTETAEEAVLALTLDKAYTETYIANATPKSQRKVAGRIVGNSGFLMERETGFEPATLSLGS